MTATHFDIVINGGGLVGNSLALALANTPYSVAVIEPYPLQDPQRSLLESRTIAISHGARRIYEGLQLWDALAPYTTPIQQIHVSDQGQFGVTRIHAQEQRMPALGYNLSISEINHVLQARMQHCPSIQLHCPARITHAHLADDHQWHIALQDEQQITCDLLIAADGAQSHLRQQLGLDVEEKDYQQIALVAVVELSRSHNNIAYERFTPTGPIAILPMQHNFAAVIFTIESHTLPTWEAMDDQAFLSMLQIQFGYRLGRFLHIGRRVAYPLKLVTAPRQTLPQFVLVGNAAHTLHPIAAQGFNLSLRDVATLAEIIHQASSHHVSLRDPALIAEYVAQRQADQTRTVRFTDSLIDIFKTPSLRAPRNLAMVGLDLFPPLKTLLGKYGAGTLGKLSRLGRGLPL